jgi:pimeloyl-ACP methyl ester carboxylesterase
MYESRHVVDRWSNRAISTIPFDSHSVNELPTVVIHPGWGKKPEMLMRLMRQLTERGIRPVGVDTRFGYADRSNSTGFTNGRDIGRLLTQPYRTSTENPYFNEQSRRANRLRLRRPTGLAALLLALNIGEASFVGHSDGGRITTTLLAESNLDINVPRLVVVNSVGVANNNGVKGMTRSNTSSNELFHGAVEKRDALESAVVSTTYGMTHPRRFLSEKRMIDEAGVDLWENLSLVAKNGADVTVLHARGDQVLDFASAAAHAPSYPGITFIPTVGGHSNIYTEDVTNQIVSLVTENN